MSGKPRAALAAYPAALILPFCISNSRMNCICPAIASGPRRRSLRPAAEPIYWRQSVPLPSIWRSAALQ